MFFTARLNTARKHQISKLDELANSTRSAIRARLKEVESVDAQLKQVIDETKQLTTHITEKLATQLKITRKTLKSVCHNLRDGVVVINSSGRIIDVNPAGTYMFGYDYDDLLGYDLNFLLRLIDTKKESGEVFELDGSFFEDMSHNIFYHLSSDINTIPKVNIDSYLIGELSHTAVMSKISDRITKLSISISVLDNDPDQFEDITYLVFFRPEA